MRSEIDSNSDPDALSAHYESEDHDDGGGNFSIVRQKKRSGRTRSPSDSQRSSVTAQQQIHPNPNRRDQPTAGNATTSQQRPSYAQATQRSAKSFANSACGTFVINSLSSTQPVSFFDTLDAHNKALIDAQGVHCQDPHDEAGILSQRVGPPTILMQRVVLSTVNIHFVAISGCNPGWPVHKLLYFLRNWERLLKTTFHSDFLLDMLHNNNWNFCPITRINGTLLVPLAKLMEARETPFYSYDVRVQEKEPSGDALRWYTRTITFTFCSNVHATPIHRDLNNCNSTITVPGLVGPPAAKALQLQTLQAFIDASNLQGLAILSTIPAKMSNDKWNTSTGAKIVLRKNPARPIPSMRQLIDMPAYQAGTHLVTIGGLKFEFRDSFLPGVHGGLPHPDRLADKPCLEIKGVPLGMSDDECLTHVQEGLRGSSFVPASAFCLPVNPDDTTKTVIILSQETQSIPDNIPTSFVIGADVTLTASRCLHDPIIEALRLQELTCLGKYKHITELPTGRTIPTYSKWYWHSRSIIEAAIAALPSVETEATAPQAPASASNETPSARAAPSTNSRQQRHPAAARSNPAPSTSSSTQSMASEDDATNNAQSRADMPTVIVPSQVQMRQSRAAPQSSSSLQTPAPAPLSTATTATTLVPRAQHCSATVLPQSSVEMDIVNPGHQSVDNNINASPAHHQSIIAQHLEELSSQVANRPPPKRVASAPDGQGNARMAAPSPLRSAPTPRAALSADLHTEEGRVATHKKARTHLTMPGINTNTNTYTNTHTAIHAAPTSPMEEEVDDTPPPSQDSRHLAAAAVTQDDGMDECSNDDGNDSAGDEADGVHHTAMEEDEDSDTTNSQTPAPLESPHTNSELPGAHPRTAGITSDRAQLTFDQYAYRPHRPESNAGTHVLTPEDSASSNNNA